MTKNRSTLYSVFAANLLSSCICKLY